MQKLRLFIAIDTPSDIKLHAGAVRDQLRNTAADARWEPDEKLHCTVKFLGDTNPGLVEPIIETVQQIAAQTPLFAVKYRAVGCFPTMRDPRVVWIGMENNDGTLLALHKKIDEAMATLGFAREERMFHPHITLGRVRSRKNIHNLLTLLETVTFESEPATLHELEIVKSELKSAGSVYTILKLLPLKA